jgi:hypothetical protein
MWYAIGVLVVIGFGILNALLTNEDNDPELAKRNSMERILRKKGLLGRRDK